MLLRWISCLGQTEIAIGTFSSFSTRLLAVTIDNEFRRRGTDPGAVDPHRGQRRMQIAGETQVAQPDHGQPAGHGDALRLGLGQHAQRHHVGAAEQRVDVGMARQQLAQAGAAHADIGRRRQQPAGHGGLARPAVMPSDDGRIGKRLHAALRALVVRAQRGDAALAARMQVARHGLAHFFMREADQHVDRIGRQVPGLHHRNAAGQQALAALGRAHDPGQHDAVGRRPMMVSSSWSSRESS
jgi:hypothetical protein